MRLPALILCAAAVHAAPAPLFNGRDLSGWVHEGPLATFSAASGELRTSGAGNAPNWLRTAKEYENFRLEFEYRVEQWGQAGVYLRAPREGRPARSGICIVLAHDFHAGVVDDHVTGAVLGAIAPKQALPPAFGVWRRVTIVLDGARLRATIEGVVVQDVEIDRSERGYIGFPDMGHPYRIRGLRLEPLPDRTPFTDLFDGKSIEGWQLRGGGNWTVRDGEIIGSGGHGILYAPGTYGDFTMTATVRTTGHVNGGIFLRGEPEGPRRGFEIQIYSPPDGVDYSTGSIYGIVRARPVADHEGRWIVMRIRLRGSRCEVWLDGEKVAETDAVPVREPGRIGLQIHSERGALEVRDLRVFLSPR